MENIREELLDFIKSGQLNKSELELLKRHIISNFTREQIFEIYEYGIKNKFEELDESLNIEIISNYSLPIRIKHKLDLIDSLNYFHRCLSDNGEPCNKYVKERCEEARNIIKEVEEFDGWNTNMISGYRKLKKYCDVNVSNDEVTENE